LRQNGWVIYLTHPILLLDFKKLLYFGSELLSMKKLILLLLFVLPFTVTKGQKPYVALSEDGKLNISCLSTEDISAHIYKAWWKVEATNGHQQEFAIKEIKRLIRDKLPTEGYDKYQSRKYEILIDCKNKKYKILMYIDYDINRNTLNKVEYDTNVAKWNDIIPESLMYTFFDCTCILDTK